jgi:hypothetical protein
MTKRNEKRDEGTTASCAHHSKIDPPSDGASRGICSRCGAKREFSNIAPKWTARPRTRGSQGAFLIERHRRHPSLRSENLLHAPSAMDANSSSYSLLIWAW